jgi:hypothetical protein
LVGGHEEVPAEASEGPGRLGRGFLLSDLEDEARSVERGRNALDSTSSGDTGEVIARSDRDSERELPSFSLTVDPVWSRS